MATIIKSPPAILLPVADELPEPNYDFGTMDDLVKKYWNNSLSNERMFPIPFWKIMQFFAASPNDEVALKVSNIETPAYVDAVWMPFDDNLEELIQDPVQVGERYYVLEESVFNGPITLSDGTTINGLKQRILAANIAHKAIIWARIGKESPGGVDQYYVFFNVADCNLLNATGGGGGATSGIKVPSGNG